jgi:hypothetical protein
MTEEPKMRKNEKGEWVRQYTLLWDFDGEERARVFWETHLHALDGITFSGNASKVRHVRILCNASGEVFHLHFECTSGKWYTPKLDT